MANPHRINRAYRIAYWSDIQRIYYTASLTRVIHRWAWAVIAMLIPSAATVLQFLAALNLAGKGGYLGTAVAYSLLAPVVAGATGRPCSPRTLQRGIGCLRRLGLVEVRRWTMPDQRLTVGDRQIVVRGTGRVPIGGGSWRSLQINIIVLTQRAIDLWCKSTELQGNCNVGQFHTHAKVAARSPVDVCVNTHKVKPQSTGDVTSTHDLDSSSRQGESTPPPPVASPPAPTVEHGTIDQQNPPSHSQDTQESTGKRHEGRSASGPADTRRTGCGCTSKRPVVLGGAPRKAGYHYGRAVVIRALHMALDRYSTREADAIFSRATFEMGSDYPAGWPVSVNWAYWCAKFPEFSDSQRRFHLHRDIIPVLKTKVAITPSEPRRFRQWTDTGSQQRDPVQLGETLDPFLSRILRSVLGKLE